MVPKHSDDYIKDPAKRARRNQEQADELASVYDEESRRFLVLYHRHLVEGLTVLTTSNNAYEVARQSNPRTAADIRLTDIFDQSIVAATRAAADEFAEASTAMQQDSERHVEEVKERLRKKKSRLRF